MAIDRRLLELALKGLQTERTRIDEEIADIRAQLGGSGSSGADSGRVRGKKKARKKDARKKVATKKRGRKKMSATQKKLITEKMKAAWARRKRAQKG
jgi:hypothetical protein